ncbi:hypothetical protein JZ751_000570 [Albula glossodonta]|uniref:KN homeodomain domain-containing protein n=1 Tax=Albula glossodonta TaxID=121402 RepID=A0A8T2PW55_9TELE|nr:hypothetical protein JZ751_000570 [Albula glossodonta]
MPHNVEPSGSLLSNFALFGCRFLAKADRLKKLRVCQTFEQIRLLNILDDTDTTKMAGSICHHLYKSLKHPDELTNQVYRNNLMGDSTGTQEKPLPHQREKIMLAIITKMTLTQVSTWFANARS